MNRRSRGARAVAITIAGRAVFRQLINLDPTPDEYSTDMPSLPQHIETRRREIVQTRRIRRLWLGVIGVAAVMAIAALLWH
jgi:hypothetical protein